MAIKIIACKSKHPFPIFGWLIQWAQKKPYSHYVISDGEYVLDSTIKGVHWTKVEDFEKKYSGVKSWYFQHRDSEPLYKWSVKYSSAPYPMAQNIGYGFKLLGIKIPNPWGKGERSINCSELVALWVRDFLGIAIMDSDEYDLIEVEKLLDNQDEAIRY